MHHDQVHAVIAGKEGTQAIETKQQKITKDQQEGQQDFDGSWAAGVRQIKRAAPNGWHNCWRR
jgi:hypothetical protein